MQTARNSRCPDSHPVFKQTDRFVQLCVSNSMEGHGWERNQEPPKAAAAQRMTPAMLALRTMQRRLRLSLSTAFVTDTAAAPQGTCSIRRLRVIAERSEEEPCRSLLSGNGNGGSDGGRNHEGGCRSILAKRGSAPIAWTAVLGCGKPRACTA